MGKRWIPVQWEIDSEESDENETEEQESGNRKPEPGRRKDGEEKM